VIAANKTDLPAVWELAALGGAPTVPVSAVSGEGLAALREAMAAALSGREALRDTPAVTNVRHATLLARAKTALERAGAAASEGTPEEFVLTDIHEARACFEEITGARSADDLLHTIFDRFCVGK
jgi:tRNA modification GTPase